MKIEIEYFKNTAPRAEWATLPASTLYRALHRTLPAVLRDETRPHMNSVFLESDGTTLKAVSTDGYRLHIASEAVTGPALKALVPRSAARVLESALAAQKGEVGLAFEPRTGFVRLGEDVFSFPLTNAQFPPYQQVIPKRSTRIATVDRAALRSALLLATRIHPDGWGMCMTRVEIGSDITVRMTSDLLPFEMACGQPLAGSHALTFGVTARFMITALRVVGGETVRIERDGDDLLNPLMVTPVSDEPGSGLLALVMPCRFCGGESWVR